MKRQIITINQNKCNGCGACATACHESAIGMVDGKATLLRDDYCDGLGNCLPICPTSAITFIERKAAAYDEVAVKRNQAAQKLNNPAPTPITLQTTAPVSSPAVTSPLAQWPVQLKLAPVQATYFDGAKLLIAADCTAYARADFHQRFMKNHVTLIGCSKLDAVDYTEKLATILTENNIKSVTVVRMDVPCCGGIELAVKNALQQSDKMLPWHVVTLTVNGEILED